MPYCIKNKCDQSGTKTVRMSGGAARDILTSIRSCKSGSIELPSRHHSILDDFHVPTSSRSLISNLTSQSSAI